MPDPLLRAPSGVELIANERRRQISKEGWSSEHDDGHDEGELIAAAIAYALAASEDAKEEGIEPERVWPFLASEFKPTDPLHNLTRAGALIAAEIDRLQRLEDG